MSNVTISIVNYRQKHLLNRCLAQINSLSLPTSWQTIVVDNNSSDDSADIVAQRHPWVKLIRLRRNLGFAGGHNTSYAQTSSPIFIVLNPDVIVLPGSLETLVTMFERFPKVAIVGPCLLNPNGSPQFSARRFYTWYTVACRRLQIPGRNKINEHHLMKDCELDKLLSVDWVLGAAMGIRRSVFLGKDLFDTRYKLYFEDVDYYSSAKDALSIFKGNPEKYLPITTVYLDDIHREPHNSYCGELLAVKEFNTEERYRKIEHHRFFENSRVFKRARWLKHIYQLHVLDHPTRYKIRTTQKVRVEENPYLS